MASTAQQNRPRRKREARPRYQQLADKLIADIRAGRLKVGATLPGEHDLVERFDVSRHTVRASLRVLEELGLIGRYQGIGTVVQSKESRRSYVQTVRSPVELLQYPLESSLSVMFTEPVRANRKLARQLRCAAGTEWVRIGAVRRMRETRLPISWVDIYVIPEYGAVADRIGRRRRPVYEIIASEFHEEVERVAIDICAGLIGDEVAPMLQVAPGSPGLTVVRRYTGSSGRQFEVSVSQHPAERFTYSLELTRGWQSGASWVSA